MSVQVPETQETKLFSFLNPLAVEIWIFVFFAYCLVICLRQTFFHSFVRSFDIVSLLKSIDFVHSTVRFHLPFGLQHDSLNGASRRSVIQILGCTRTILHCPIGENCRRLNENFKIYYQFKTSFWFVIGTLMQQGSDLNPKVRIFPFLGNKNLSLFAFTIRRQALVLLEASGGSSL